MGRSAATLRSYGMDLLRWWRFLDAVGVAWDRASRVEARDFSCWIQLTVKQRLQTSRPRAARWSSGVLGAPNPVTGKPGAGDGYAPASIAHSETVLRRFYDFHRDARQRADREPVPAGSAPPLAAGACAPQPDATVEAGAGRAGTGRRCRGGSRARSPTTGSTSCSPRCRRTGTGRWWRSGSPPAFGRRSCSGCAGCDVHPGEQLISVVRKGSRAVQQVPASADAFVWLRLYQQDLLGQGVPRGRRQPAVVDAAPAVSAADLPRGAPHVRAGQRRARR